MPYSDRRVWIILKYGYDRNKELRTRDDVLRALRISQRLCKVIEPLGMYIFKLAHEFMDNSKYKGYQWKDDMMGYAVLMMTNCMMHFDLTKSHNVDGYLDAVFRSAVLNVIHKERKEASLKIELMDRVLHGQLE